MDIENRLKVAWDVVNIVQRCAELFVMRHFRITGTIEGLLRLSPPLSSNHVVINTHNKIIIRNNEVVSRFVALISSLD